MIFSQFKKTGSGISIQQRKERRPNTRCACIVKIGHNLVKYIAHV